MNSWFYTIPGVVDGTTDRVFEILEISNTEFNQGDDMTVIGTSMTLELLDFSVDSVNPVDVNVPMGSITEINIVAEPDPAMDPSEQTAVWVKFRVTPTLSNSI